MRRNALWWVMTLSSFGIAIYGLVYIFIIPPNQHFAPHIVLLRFHIAGGVGALLSGPFQFSQRLRTRNLALHRWLGRFYLVEVAVGSVAGLGMATVSEQGLPTHIGFGLLAVLWFVTALEAYRAVLRRQIESHRRWMIRNFALTLAAVTLRNELPLMLFVLHWPFSRAYVMVAWLCWVPNMIVAELLLRRRLAPR